MKKGFTLAELIGVMVLVAAIALVTGLVVTKTIQNGKENLLNKQNDMIKNALAIWASNNKPALNSEYHITLSQLKEAGLIAADIKNVNTKEYLPNDMVLKVKNENGIIRYEVDNNGNCKSDYMLTPRLEFDSIVYVEINSSYTDSIATSKLNDEVLNNITSTGSVDITTLGTNYITYNIYKDGHCNAGIKNVVVTDTIAPVITFTGDISVNASQVNSYDYMTGVTVTDNSMFNPTVTIERNFPALSGKYSIKYIAKDSSGNTVEKYRTVIVN